MTSLRARVSAWLSAERRQTILPPDTRLLAMPDLVPPGFAQGLEILNDAGTPMPFVIESLQRHLAMKEAAAIETMVRIHARGGILIPLGSLAEADRVAQALTAEARDRGYPLICRPVSTAS